MGIIESYKIISRLPKQNILQKLALLAFAGLLWDNQKQK